MSELKHDYRMDRFFARVYVPQSLDTWLVAVQNNHIWSKNNENRSYFGRDTPISLYGQDWSLMGSMTPAGTGSAREGLRFCKGVTYEPANESV